MGQFALILIDEVHVLGEDRGAALEAVSKPVLFKLVPRTVCADDVHYRRLSVEWCVDARIHLQEWVSGSRVSMSPLQKAVAQSPVVSSHGWPARSTRVVALSATLPNLADIAA